MTQVIHTTVCVVTVLYTSKGREGVGKGKMGGNGGERREGRAGAETPQRFTEMTPLFSIYKKYHAFLTYAALRMSLMCNQ